MAIKYNKGEALPVETRLRMYKKLLSFYESGFRSGGFCLSAKYLLMEKLGLEWGVYIAGHPYLLPELYEFRTYLTYADSVRDDCSGYWYRNDEERIEALKKAIKLLTTK